MNKSILVLAAATAAFAANAEVLTPEQALARVRVDGPARIHSLQSSGDAALRPVYTQSAGSLPAAYVFDTRSGYMVVSADDVAAPLLGYADEGSFDAANIPDNLRYWLESYASEIAWARDNGVEPARSRASRADRAPIAPLVKTQWNQGSPYNNYCPIYNGSRSVTGCVATAMAQVMKYYNYPAKGTGSHSYTTNTLKISQSMDFSSTSFRWTSMADSYGSFSSTSQKNAVATLMHACGVSVDMDYTPNESGAPSMNVASALTNYFGYDKGVRYLMRDYYGMAEWEDLVYNQLVEFGPVQYSGSNTSAGHSFVCDGYSSDGYFHFNWGWGGMSDGYFLLTALDPTSQGIGGSTAGYNSGQDIIANVAKSGEGKMYEQMLIDGDFKIDTPQVQKGGYVVIVANAYNYSIAPISGFYGLKFTASDGSVTYAEAPTGVSNVAVLSGYGGWYVRMPSLAAGTYTVTPAWKSTTGEWFDIRAKVSAVKSYTATVSGNTAVFTADSAPQIYVKDIDVATPLYFNTTFKINATIENPTQDEYYGGIEAVLLNSGNNVVALADIYPVDVLGGESQQMEYVAKFSRYNSQLGVPSAGTYTLVFLTESNQIVSDPVTVQLLEALALTSVSVSSFSVEGDANAVAADNLQFNLTANCTAGYFANTLSVYIFPISGGSAIAYFDTPTLFIEEGKSATTMASGNFSQGVVGTKYMAAVFSGQQQLSDIVYFTVGSYSGIADVDADDNAPVEYYTIDGMRVDQPEKGLYIVRQGSKVSKVLF
ncbi:MAG: C10 family peptidase [Bacteroides sp.]|nr:C10 family peptidase [Bacteroides sp.]MCM1457027.1 C10 family peptidase [Lachnoclostridium sp.]